MKIKTLLLSVLALAAIVVVGFHVFSSEKQENLQDSAIHKKTDTAMLLVTFGSTWEASHATYKNMQKQFAQAFPHADQYMAFTSRICIKRWAQKTGERFETPGVMLENLRKAGYKKIMVQSLHVIPGKEYTSLRDHYVKEFVAKHPEVSVVLGQPLLTDIGEKTNYGQDAIELGDVLLNAFKPQLDAGESLVLIGHGNSEDEYLYANRSYHMIEQYMRSKNKHVFVGTVDYNSMLFPYVLKNLDATYTSTQVVNLTPLMSIAGDHANNDMAGEKDLDKAPEDQSWKVMLNASGRYRVEPANCYLKGLGEYPAVVDIWIRHMKEADAAAE